MTFFVIYCRVLQHDKKRKSDFSEPIKRDKVVFWHYKKRVIILYYNSSLIKILRKAKKHLRKYKVVFSHYKKDTKGQKKGNKI